MPGDAEALVEGGLSATDPRARETLVALLSDTNLPALLDQLKHAFHRTISRLRCGDRRPPSSFFRPDGVRDHTGAFLLSWEGRPTPLMSIVQAKPYLPDHVEPSESALVIVPQRHWDRLGESWSSATGTSPPSRSSTTRCTPTAGSRLAPPLLGAATVPTRVACADLTGDELHHCCY